MLSYIASEPTLARDLEPFNVEPLGFLDFETVYRAVPVWDGMKPWEQAPAQLSYHESLLDGTHRHEEYLAEGPNDARQELARRLVNATRNAVKVVHYSPFEKTRIRALQVCVPELAQELFVADRIPALERDRVRADLLAYCKMDTWATVRLVEELRRILPFPDLRNGTTIT